jgi:hypothetical protein
VGELPHRAIRRALALLPVLLTGAMLLGQAISLRVPPGPRDSQGIVKGHDFAHFYTLGVIGRSGELRQLYDGRALNDTMWRAVPATQHDIYLPLYGPQVAAAFAPLAALPYERAAQVWLLASLLMYAGAAAGIVWLVPASPVPRVVVALTLALNPALGPLVTSGQTSAVALIAFVIGWFALARHQRWAAGLALGLLWYKPTLVFGVAALLLVMGEWRMLAGFAAAAVLQLAIGWMWAGTTVIVAYIRTMIGIVAAGGIPASQPEHLHSLLGFWRLLVGPGIPSALLWLASSLVVLTYLRRVWRLAAADPSLQIGALCLAAVLLAPHLYVYDLVLLSPALVAFWAWSERSPSGARMFQLLVALAAVAPLSDRIAALVGLQLSTCVIAALSVQCARVLAKAQPDTPSG